MLYIHNKLKMNCNAIKNIIKIYSHSRSETNFFVKNSMYVDEITVLILSILRCEGSKHSYLSQRLISKYVKTEYNVEYRTAVYLKQVVTHNALTSSRRSICCSRRSCCWLLCSRSFVSTTLTAVEAVIIQVIISL